MSVSGPELLAHSSYHPLLLIMSRTKLITTKSVNHGDGLLQVSELLYAQCLSANDSNNSSIIFIGLNWSQCKASQQWNSELITVHYNILTLHRLTILDIGFKRSYSSLHVAEGSEGEMW